MPKTYLCKNPACTLGTVGEPGRFTGGITKEGLHALTGAPIDLMTPKDYGNGYCPNCGKKGTAE